MSVEKIIAAGGVVWNQHQEILMIFRRGHWDLPKGKLDENETVEQCALREVVEETGVSPLRLGRFIMATEHHYFDNIYTKKNILKQTHWFEMYADNNSALLPQQEEGIEKVEWVSLDKLTTYLNASYDTIRQVLHSLSAFPKA